MDIQRKTMTFIFGLGADKYEGAFLFFSEEPNDYKIIKTITDYDSLTHVFTVEFTNGDVQQISDKIRIGVVFTDDPFHRKLKRAVNQRRPRIKW